MEAAPTVPTAGVPTTPREAPQAYTPPKPIIQHREHEQGALAGQVRQAGQLTAADHDDLLNPELYEAYAGRFRQRLGRKDYPSVDVREQLSLQVLGRDHRPAPLTPVTVLRADGSALRLATKADGRLVLFPTLDHLGDRIVVSATDPAGTVVSRSVTLHPGKPRKVTLRLPTRARPVQAVDVLLVMDTTGSMADELSYLTAELSDILGGLGERHPGVDLQTGLLFYRDLSDEYTVRTFPFTGDRRAVRATLAQQSANGGGDFPEAMQTALKEADAYPWRDNAVKVMLLVADAPPHEADRADAWTLLMAARARNIHVTPVAASGADDDTQYLMRAAAAVSQSRYIFITDDSGIGNPHAEPSVDCYAVTKLNGLIDRVVDGLVSGARIESEPGAVVRKVGTYDRGVCRAARPSLWRRLFGGPAEATKR